MQKAIKNSAGSKGEIIIYKSPEGDTAIDVKLYNETLWLTHQQIAVLFGRDRTVITRHLQNIFSTKEIIEKSNVQKMHIPNSDKPVKFYNLDVIISVGYRVNSKRGTQFRIWANKILKEYLVQGYALNEKRLKEQSEKVKELEKSIEIFKRVADNYQLVQDEFSGILNVISDYTYALDILDQYDHQKVKTEKAVNKEAYKITYEDAIKLVKNLRKKFGGSALFGREKDESLKSTIGTIYQTFNKKELYPGLDEKAAMLLYLAVKNHSFVDGNKRIAAALFLMYMSRNNYLYSSNGEKRIADNALVALCLMIAASNPKEKDIICKVVANLINKKNN